MRNARRIANHSAEYTGRRRWRLYRAGVPLMLLSLGVVPACSRESPSEGNPPGSSALASSCPSGQREESGACVPIAPGAPMASESSPAASASAAPAAPPGRCPDATNPDRVAAFDWSKELGVEAALAAKLHALAEAAAETKALSVEIENELKAACVRLAVGLGAKGPFGPADVTCQAAADALRSAREKLGKTAKVTTSTHQPVCPLAIDGMQECAKACSSAGWSGETRCDGAPAGKCAAGCDGVCEQSTPGVCRDVCLGRCASAFTGKCGGTCKGTCDGKPMPNGTCAGKCEGACEGTANGDCKGLCEGGCQGKSMACTGVCVGKCAAGMKEASCLGTLRPADLGTECLAACTTRVVRKAICSLPSVAVRVDGAKDAAASGAYEQAIDHALPLLLRVERKLKGRVDGVSRNGKIVSDGLKDATGRGVRGPAGACLLPIERAVTEGTKSVEGNFRALSLVTTLAQAR